MFTVRFYFSVVLLVALCASANAEDGPREAATVLVAAFKSGKAENVRKHIAVLELEERVAAKKELIEKDLIGIYQGICGDTAAGKSEWEIVDSKSDGECAVVIINESKKQGRPAQDFDPLYFVKQNESWKVLPRLSEYKSDVWKLKEEMIKKFTDLEAWFETRKQELVAKK